MIQVPRLCNLQTESISHQLENKEVNHYNYM